MLRGPSYPQRYRLTSSIALIQLVHIPLALLLYQYPQLATLHAWAVLALGLFYAAGGRHLERVAYVGAYITSAEVLWRMTGAGIPWEFGKYATILIFTLALLRIKHVRLWLVPFLYLGLLVPSTIETLRNMDFAEARDQISFNLSGPFALSMAAWFFWNVKLSASQFRQLLVTILGPIVGVAALALFSTLTAASLRFGHESNFVTSGGFGPNQVSAVLGLGALVAFLLAVDADTGSDLRLWMFGVLAALAIQSALTFSRGGLYNAGGAAIVASVFLFTKSRSRFGLIGISVLGAAMAYYVVLPRLDDFTGGALSERFLDTNLTGRDRLMRADLETWRENMAFGVGPGQAKLSRASRVMQSGVAAHTEFTRLLAEHGALGIAALVALVVMGLRAFRRATGARERGVAAAMMAWSLLFMSNAAMRVVAPSFLFGLACSKIELDRRAVGQRFQAVFSQSKAAARRFRIPSPAARSAL